MLRLEKFSCGMHGSFEKLLEIDPNDCDGTFRAVQSQMCPACGEFAPAVIGAPRLKFGTMVTTMPDGRMYERDALEARLDQKNERPNFWDRPDFEQDFKQRAARIINQELNGDLPRAIPESMPDDATPGLDRAAASVDVERVKASQDQVTQLFRKTEFPE